MTDHPATHGIATEERTSTPGFDSNHEATGLAIGMDEKVYWSRLLRIGGPLARRDSSRIVGGKCVLHPTADAPHRTRCSRHCRYST